MPATFPIVMLAACLLIAGCKGFEKAILKSRAGGNAFAKAAYSVEKYYRNDFSICEVEGFKIEKTPPGVKSVLLVHGFGSGGGIWGNLEDPHSTVSLAHEIFDGRVLVANCPSGESIDGISDEPLDVTYHFFVFKRTHANSFFIPGRDDSLISPASAYPHEVMKEGRFNPDIMRQILTILKQGSAANPVPHAKRAEGVIKISIPRAHPHEIEYREGIFDAKKSS